MALYAGFDEAGYGSLLGPMAIGACSFRVPDELATSEGGEMPPPPHLWRLLAPAVCKRSGDRRGRLAIADSKKLKGRGGADEHDAVLLERGVLGALVACSAVAGDEPGEGWCDESSILAALHAAPPPPHPPWTAPPLAIPFACDGADARLAGHALRRALSRVKCELTALRVDVREVEALNDAFARGIAKPSIPFSACLERAAGLITASGERTGWLAFDRQGGRMHYREDLQRAFPGSAIAVLQENERESAYLVALPVARDAVVGTERARYSVTFTVGAEEAHMPVALASMAAKFVRELRMARFNRYFAAFDATLQPTAGYVQDGRRFLADIAPILSRTELSERQLVRIK